MVIFDKEFIASLPSEPATAAKAMCNRFFECDKQLRQQAVGSVPDDSQLFLNALAAMAPNTQYHDAYVEAAAAFSAYCEAHDLPFGVPNLGERHLDNMKTVVNSFTQAQSKLTEKVAQLTFEKAKNQYGVQFGAAFEYEFTDGDLERLQQSINDLRTQISQAKCLDEDHRQRLLSRLEKVQGELHKRISDLDRFWGLIGDAGVVVGKLGDDAKPIVDRIREIAQIVWNTQARAEELPSDSKPALLDRNVTDSEQT